MRSEEFKSKVTQLLERKMTGRKGIATQIAIDVIAKGKIFNFLYPRKISEKMGVYLVPQNLA